MFLCLNFLMLRVCSSLPCGRLLGKGLLAFVGDVYCICVTYPCGILGQVWCLIVSFPEIGITMPS